MKCKLTMGTFHNIKYTSRKGSGKPKQTRLANFSSSRKKISLLQSLLRAAAKLVIHNITLLCTLPCFLHLSGLASPKLSISPEVMHSGNVFNIVAVVFLLLLWTKRSKRLSKIISLKSKISLKSDTTSS